MTSPCAPLPPRTMKREELEGAEGAAFFRGILLPVAARIDDANLLEDGEVGIAVVVHEPSADTLAALRLLGLRRVSRARTTVRCVRGADVDRLAAWDRETRRWLAKPAGDVEFKVWLWHGNWTVLLTLAVPPDGPDVLVYIEHDPIEAKAVAELLTPSRASG